MKQFESRTSSNSVFLQPLRRGDRVVIRSFDEITCTLDANGTLDGLPFMPEMIAFCGREVKVHRRLEKICVEAPWFQFRRLVDVVTLEGLECSGLDHGGCQRCCMLLWKEEWLRSESNLNIRNLADDKGGMAIPHNLPTQRPDGRYICQSSELPGASLDPERTLRFRCASEFDSGNVGLSRAVELVAVPSWLKLRQRVTGVAPWQMPGNLERTPSESLGLQPGGWVEVKSLADIRATLDRQSRNRGLSFTRLMAAFCGKRYRVKTRVDRIIFEGSGVMRSLRDTVLLEGVTCDGSIFPGGCSRGTYHFWRDIWLRPVDGPHLCGSEPSKIKQPGDSDQRKNQTLSTGRNQSDRWERC